MSIKPLTSLFFIALIPDTKTEQELYQFKIDLFEKYGYKVSLKSPAHITLIPPFSWLQTSTEELIEIFTNFLPTVASFDLKIQGFDTFGDSVFYAKLICPPEIFNLQNEIYQYFSPYLNTKNNYQFNPHITIANRDINRNDLPKIIADYQLKTYHRQTQISAITLFKHNGTKWQIETQLPLR
ncbi:MAG: 2'-5' RNA ligase family protein [Chitinophagales bacterium]|nr:2'-5' RNA ligase family protein [Chitinophagales bacterium]MCZ2392794.1 2'-5' RNA ligase family protein [Chitinophagales bacterium]